MGVYRRIACFNHDKVFLLARIPALSSLAAIHLLLNGFGFGFYAPSLLATLHLLTQTCTG
jgi:hypothetical protein